MRNFWNN